MYRTAIFPANGKPSPGILLPPMNVANLYLNGDIFNEPMKGSEEFGIVSLRTVKDFLAQNQEAEEIIVHLHSRGGDVNEGFAIHDALVSSGKKITVIVEGLCASIATVVFLAGSTRKMTENSEFLIHNPWIDPFSLFFSGSATDADGLEAIAEDLRIAEDKLVSFYETKTGLDGQTIRDLMKEERKITADEALEMKFATEVVKTVKALAHFRPTASANTTAMSKEIKALSTRIESWMKDLGKMLNLSTDPKNLDVTCDDGTTLSVETEGEDVAVGDKVMKDGAAAPDGDYKLADGRTLKVAGGVVSEIVAAPPAQETPENKLNALIKENERLQAEIQERKEAEAEITKNVTKLEEVLAKVKSTYVPPARQTQFAQPQTEKADEDRKREATERRAARSK